MRKQKPRSPPRRQNAAQSCPNASQSESKMEPLGAKVCFLKTAFGLRLCVRITWRPLPRNSPGHSKKASCRKIHQNAFHSLLWAGIWGTRRENTPKVLEMGAQVAPNGTPWAPQCLPKSIKKRRPEPEGTPAGSGVPAGPQNVTKFDGKATKTGSSTRWKNS